MHPWPAATATAAVPHIDVAIEYDAALGQGLPEAGAEGIPEPECLRGWVRATLVATLGDAQARGTLAAVQQVELSVGIVPEPVIRALNRQYRHKDSVTNVLSFPDGLCLGDELQMLGDVIVCPGVVAQEAGAQGKTLQAHWAHMLVHGTLHLLGYDHAKEPQAGVMEALEIRILSSLGYVDPYTPIPAEGG